MQFPEWFVAHCDIRKMAGAKNLIRPLRVLVDMDGVMCDFELHMLTEFRKRFPHEPNVSLTDRRTFYMAEQYEQLKPGLAVRNFYYVCGISNNLMVSHLYRLS